MYARCLPLLEKTKLLTFVAHCTSHTMCHSAETCSNGLGGRPAGDSHPARLATGSERTRRSRKTTRRGSWCRPKTASRCPHDPSKNRRIVGVASMNDEWSLYLRPKWCLYICARNQGFGAAGFGAAGTSKFFFCPKEGGPKRH